MWILCEDRKKKKNSNEIIILDISAKYTEIMCG